MPQGYFTLLWLHVFSLPSELEKPTDNESPLTAQTMVEGTGQGAHTEGQLRGAGRTSPDLLTQRVYITQEAGHPES